MDKIDLEIEELVKNRCCISFKKHLDRLSEGEKMFEKCAMCQTQKTGEGYGEIPPSKEWVDEDEECKSCDAMEWFNEHTKK